MKTKVGHYYVFFSLVDLWEKVNYWKSKGHVWIQSNYPDYNPTIKKEDMPCVLNVDNWTMIWGKVDANRKNYFSDPTFVTLYNKNLRKYKLKRILKEKK